MLKKEIEEYMTEEGVEDGDAEKAAYFILALMEGPIFLKKMISDDRQYEEIGQYLKETALMSMKKGKMTG